MIREWQAMSITMFPGVFSFESIACTSSRHPACDLVELVGLLRIGVKELHLRERRLQHNTHQTSRLREAEKQKATYILISQRINQLRLAPGELRLPREHIHRARNLTLLQKELREGCDRSLTLRVNLERLLAASLGGGDILFPLVEGESFVDEGKDVHWRRSA